MESRVRTNIAKTLRFEPLAEEHLPGVLAIEKQSNTAPWSERSFRNELVHEHGIFLVALAGGGVVGYGGVWLVIDEAHITNIAIDPVHRRQGIGRRLMLELLKRAKEKGMTCSTLEVRASNESAIRMYEGLGYKVTATRKGYYPDNKEDAVVMWMYDLEGWEDPSR
jgi:[ribosomal protein S18]-alanine N-acetyltransferase